jgi:hypothetical protein
MSILILISLLCNIAIIGYFVYKYWPFYIEVNKTFWCGKAYSFTIMKYVYRGKSYTYSKDLLTINFKNFKKLEVWDNKMFQTGEYKKI